MKFFQDRALVMIILLSISFVDAKRATQVQWVTPAAQEEMPPTDLPEPMEIPQVDISKLPKPLDAPEVIEERKSEMKGREQHARETKERGKRQARERREQQKPQSMQEYARNKVTAFSQKVIDDVFPKQATIERLVFEFKDEFPGPDKESDITILYNALINNPDIKKNITLKNAVPTYNFIKEALSKAWDKKDNLVWRS